MKKVLVIGGSNIDFIGKTFGEVIYGDSNIGSIDISFGGVGRNIVENLSRMYADVTFITAIGNDYLGEALRKELVDLNVKVINPLVNDKSGGYLSIHGNDGDMKLALCDQKIISSISIDYLESLKELIHDFEFIVLDTNLDKDVIEYIVNLYQDKKILLDVISTEKAKKIENVVSKISFIKCNKLEAESLFGDNYFENFSNNTLIVTNGKEDIQYNQNKKINYSKVNEVKDIVNTTGAGDAFFSGVIFGLLNDLPLETAIEIGKDCSYQTLKCSGAVNKNLIYKKE